MRHSPQPHGILAETGVHRGPAPMQPVSARDSILGTYHCKCGLPASERGTLGGFLKSIDWVQLVEYLERCSTGNGPTCTVIPEQPDSDLDTLSTGVLRLDVTVLHRSWLHQRPIRSPLLPIDDVIERSPATFATSPDMKIGSDYVARLGLKTSELASSSWHLR